MTIQMIMLQEESLQLNLKSFKIVNNFFEKNKKSWYESQVD